jgi:molecular chaperone DnaK (HSP70)
MKEGVSAQLLDLSDAVVTVPANATGGARYRTRAAAALGGVRVRALLNEPTAAAISYARDVPIPGRFLVFDWGGGTIDVTVLEYDDGLFEEQTSRGITALGGLEFDNALAKLIR